MNILELIIGFSFVFLLLSLLATALQEAISSLFSLRGKMLLRTLAKFLEVESGAPFRRFRWLVKNRSHNYQKIASKNFGSRRLPSYFTQNQLIAVLQDILDDDEFAGYNPREHISPEEQIRYNVTHMTNPLLRNKGIESEARIPVFSCDKMDDHVLRENLLVIQQEVRCYYDKTQKVNADQLMTAKKGVIKAFDEISERATGWYKRQIQVYLFLIGLVIAFAVDGDSFKIYKKLTTDHIARSQLVEMAELYTKANSNLISDSQQRFQKGVDSLMLQQLQEINHNRKEVSRLLGLGWQELPEYDPKRASIGYTLFIYPGSVVSSAWEQFSIGKFIGFIITALAISLGAAFWFDILKKLINIRSSGKRPPTGAEAQAQGVTIIVDARKDEPTAVG